ncbi:hypothetical protein D3C87_600130 [compost metagenome]
MSATARADEEGSHPLTGRPFPLAALAAKAPAAILVWYPDDGPTKRKLGEAKLVELVASRPTLTAHSLQVRSPKPNLAPPYGNGLLISGWIERSQLAPLQAAETPFIVTIDPAGLVHRFSYFDHWPMLSVVEPRFGPMPTAPRKPGWRRIFR